MSYNPKVVPFDRNATYMHHRAMKNRRDRNVVDALELMRRAVEKSPENREYRLDLAEMYCEMGCHEQSSRLLLDMLAEDDAPAECYYGLALNRLGMNDVEGARRALALYQRKAPGGSHGGDARRLTDELEICDVMNRPVSRREFRAERVFAGACECMRTGDLQRACRLFERSLSVRDDLCDVRALYALALHMMDRSQEALEQAALANEGGRATVRSLCVSAQVLFLEGRTEDSRALIRRAIDEKPDGNERRLLLYTLGEVGMHAEVADCARAALRESPCDRGLLHVLAVATLRTGGDWPQARRCWHRILRIDPEDSVAAYYHDEAKDLDPSALQYAYQVPEEECHRRMAYITANMVADIDEIERRWHGDPTFRRMLKWAVGADDGQFRRAAMTAMAAIESPEAESVLRVLLNRQDTPLELKLQANMLLRLRNADMKRLLPPDVDERDGLLPDAEALLRPLSVGQRQLIRFASDVLLERAGLSAESALALTWEAYRRFRSLRCDPLMRTETAAAALLYCYLVLRGEKPNMKRLAHAFGCGQRQLIYFARRMADALERGGQKSDEAD